VLNPKNLRSESVNWQKNNNSIESKSRAMEEKGGSVGQDSVKPSSKLADKDGDKASSSFSSSPSRHTVAESKSQSGENVKNPRYSSSLDEKAALDDQEADEEFAALMGKPNTGVTAIAEDPKAQRIVSGLRIKSMNMRDAKNGRLIWQSDDWGDDMFEREMVAHIPREILECRAVSREIIFSSKSSLDKFRLEQRVFFNGVCIEEWFFAFGFVIPGSTNTWQQIIQAASPDKIIPADLLSGNVTFETSFYDDKMFLCKNLVRIFYD